MNWKADVLLPVPVYMTKIENNERMKPICLTRHQINSNSISAVTTTKPIIYIFFIEKDNPYIEYKSYLWLLFCFD